MCAVNEVFFAKQKYRAMSRKFLEDCRKGPLGFASAPPPPPNNNINPKYLNNKIKVIPRWFEHFISKIKKQPSNLNKIKNIIA